MQERECQGSFLKGATTGTIRGKGESESKSSSDLIVRGEGKGRKEERRSSGGIWCLGWNMEQKNGGGWW